MCVTSALYHKPKCHRNYKTHFHQLSATFLANEKRSLIPKARERPRGKHMAFPYLEILMETFNRISRQSTSSVSSIQSMCVFYRLYSVHTLLHLLDFTRKLTSAVYFQQQTSIEDRIQVNIVWKALRCIFFHSVRRNSEGDFFRKGEKIS